MRTKGPGEICVYLLLSIYSRVITHKRTHTPKYTHTHTIIFTSVCLVNAENKSRAVDVSTGSVPIYLIIMYTLQHV